MAMSPWRWSRIKRDVRMLYSLVRTCEANGYGHKQSVHCDEVRKAALRRAPGDRKALSLQLSRIEPFQGGEIVLQNLVITLRFDDRRRLYEIGLRARDRMHDECHEVVHVAMMTAFLRRLFIGSRLGSSTVFAIVHDLWPQRGAARPRRPLFDRVLEARKEGR